MLSIEANERLTRVGPGTPAGELLRCYWHPIAYVDDLAPGGKEAIRVLGEDLVLYRDHQDSWGLLAEHCSHRGVSLAYGFVESDCTIRCAYHGWKYGPDGRVRQMPFEPPASRFPDKVHHPAYPTRVLGGIVFGYLGHGEPPGLPRWDLLARDDGWRTLEHRPITEANWLQIQENSADVTHTFFLHGHMLHTHGSEHPSLDTYYRPFVRYGFQEFPLGLLKTFTIEKDGEDSVAEIGNPLLFPNMLRIREGLDYEAMHWRVPVDDHRTRIMYAGFRPGDRPADEPLEQVVRKEEWSDDDGRYIMDKEFYPQDKMAWETPGPVFDRTGERLGASDRGIVIYRRMLAEQIDRVERGEDPMGVVRGPAADETIEITSVARGEEVTQGVDLIEVTPWRRDD